MEGPIEKKQEEGVSEAVEADPAEEKEEEKDILAGVYNEG